MTPEQAKAVLVTTAARGGNMVWVGEFFQQKRLVVTTAARGGNMVWANNPTFASGAESHNGRTGRQYGLGKDGIESFIIVRHNGRTERQYGLGHAIH